MVKAKRVRGHDGDRVGGLAGSRQDVEDHVSRVDAFTERLRAGGLDGRKSVAQHRGEDGNHLTPAVRCSAELAPDALEARWQDPVFERRAVAQGAGLPRQNRHIMPGIVDRLVPTEAAGVFTDNPPVLT